MTEIINDMKKAYELANHILNTIPMSRNSDNVLILQVWSYQTEKQEIPISSATNLVKATSVSRARRRIQNTEGRLLPTSPAIILQRRINEDKIRKYYGENSNKFQSYLNAKYQIK